jgi:hypothetical protein
MTRMGYSLFGNTPGSLLRPRPMLFSHVKFWKEASAFLCATE